MVFRILQTVFATDGQVAGISLPVVVGIALALFTSVAVPIVFRWQDRKRAEEDANRQKQERTEKEVDDLVRSIINQKMTTAFDQLKQQENDLKNLEREIARVDKAHLEQLNKCHTCFVSSETYKNDLQTQKYYYKLIYNMIRQQLSSLGTDTDPGLSEDDE